MPDTSSFFLPVFAAAIAIAAPVASMAAPKITSFNAPPLFAIITEVGPSAPPMTPIEPVLDAILSLKFISVFLCLFFVALPPFYLMASLRRNEADMAAAARRAKNIVAKKCTLIRSFRKIKSYFDCIL
jgi:hypothetical protein